MNSLRQLSILFGLSLGVVLLMTMSAHATLEPEVVCPAGEGPGNCVAEPAENGTIKFFPSPAVIPVDCEVALVATVKDSAGDPCSGITVTFTASGGTFNPSNTATTASNGQASVNVKWSASGQKTFDASAAPSNGGTFSEDPGSDDGVDVVEVIDVTANGATKVTDVEGDAEIFHFAAPKGGSGDKITLTASIFPNTQEVKDTITWEGATQDTNDPLKATVDKSASAKHIVKIKVNNKDAKEMRAWVVWATGQASSTGSITILRPNVSDQHNPSQTGVGTAVKSKKWDFTFTISPASMLTDADRPDFTGSKVNDPPAGTHITTGGSLSGGATKKWDVSRQMRVRALSPSVGTVWFEDVGAGTIYDNLPASNQVQEDYPTDDVKGNDDRLTGDEVNIPNSSSEITSIDIPTIPVLRDAGGNVGDTVEYRLHFKEFARLEIEGVWHRISDFLEWRFHGKLQKKDESIDGQDYNGDTDQLDKLWINNGSISDQTNNGW